MCLIFINAFQFEWYTTAPDFRMDIQYGYAETAYPLSLIAEPYPAETVTLNGDPKKTDFAFTIIPNNFYSANVVYQGYGLFVSAPLGGDLYSFHVSKSVNGTKPVLDEAHGEITVGNEFDLKFFNSELVFDMKFTNITESK